MIKSIEISNVATYGGTPQVISDLHKFNYFFGSNGSGKTTIARVITNPDSFDHCALVWEGGSKLQTLVYDRDWIGQHFDQSEDIEGVFTLGEHHVNTLREIEEEKKKLDGLIEKRAGLTATLRGEDGDGGKEGDLAALEVELSRFSGRVNTEIFSLSPPAREREASPA